MAWEIISGEGVLADFLTPILPEIGGEPTIEGLIDLHQLVSGNASSMASNLKRGRHRQLALTMTAEENKIQTGFAFVPSHNPRNHLQSIGNSKEQALRTEKFRQNQALFRKYTAVDGTFKNHIVAVVELVFVSTLVHQLTSSGQLYTLTMLQHPLSSYREIDEIDLEENTVNMMGPYNPAEPLSQLVEQLKRGR